MIVKTLAGGFVQELVEGVVLVFVFVAFKFAQDFFLRRREHGIKPAQHRHGQHDALVLRRTIRAAQQIRDLPDEIGQLVMIGHGARIWKCKCVSNPPTGWAATVDMPRNDRGFGLGADVARTGHGQTVGAVSLRSGRGHGLTTDAVADWMWPRTDHGQFMVTDWSRTDSRKIPGRCAETSVAIPWTFPDAAGKLPGCCADATPDTAPDATRTLLGSCLTIARTIHRMLRG
jgi:hypothetical protein